MADTVITASGSLQIVSSDGITTDTIKFSAGTIERLSDNKTVLFDGDAQAPLSFSPEDAANKTNTLTNSTTQYPSGAAVFAEGYVNAAEAAAAAPVQSVAGLIGNVTLTKSNVGLGNVDNTADTAKPVSTLQAEAIATKQSVNTTVAGLKAIVSPQTNVLYQTTDYGTGNWYYTDQVIVENTGTVIVSNNGKSFKRIFSGDSVSAAWFGAKGDGITDDTKAIQDAIDYCAGVDGGTVVFGAKTYAVTEIKLKKGVGLLGVVMQPSAAVEEGERTTVIKSISPTPSVATVSLYPDNKFKGQEGEETGNKKSSPNIEIKNICFFSNGLSRHCVYVAEAWGIAFDKCKFKGSSAHALHIFDCNNFSVKNCAIYGLYLNSCADYNVSDNELSGNNDLSPYLFVNSDYGLNDGNKIYQDSLFYNPYASFNVISVDANGLFTILAEKNLMAGQHWELFDDDDNGNSTVNYNVTEDKLTNVVAPNK